MLQSRATFGHVVLFKLMYVHASISCSSLSATSWFLQVKGKNTCFLSPSYLQLRFSKTNSHSWAYIKMSIASTYKQEYKSKPIIHSLFNSGQIRRIFASLQSVLEENLYKLSYLSLFSTNLTGSLPTKLEPLSNLVFF